MTKEVRGLTEDAHNKKVENAKAASYLKHESKSITTKTINQKKEIKKVTETVKTVEEEVRTLTKKWDTLRTKSTSVSSIE